MFYLAVAVTAAFIDHVFLSILILDFAFRIPTLQNVIMSVRQNLAHLTWTFIFIVILLFIYTVIGFFYFDELFYDGNINKFDSSVDGESTCQDMVNCFVYIINLVPFIF